VTQNIAHSRRCEGVEVRFVDDAEVTRVLTFPILFAAIEAAHRRQKMEVLDGYLGIESEQYVVRSAVDPGRFMAPKTFTSFPANLAKGAMPPAFAPRWAFVETTPSFTSRPAKRRYPRSFPRWKAHSRFDTARRFRSTDQSVEPTKDRCGKCCRACWAASIITSPTRRKAG
jgi:hypothetical protein